MDIDLTNIFNNLFDKVQGWVEEGIMMVPNLILSLVILFIFIVAANLSKKALTKILQQFSDNAAVRQLLGTILRITVIGLGVFAALSVLELEKTVTSLLAGAGIIGLALSFAFQDFAINLMAGVAIAIKRPFKIGDVIKTNDLMGTVEAISLRSSRVKTFSGQMVIIPNKEIYQNAIIKYSTGKRRVEIPVGVSYATDLPKASKAVIEAIQQLDCIAEGTDVTAYYNGFGGSSIDLDVRFWIPYDQQGPYLSARHEAVIAIKKAFDKENITIPFPIRTLDFGIEGGEKLNPQMLSLTNRNDN